MIYLYTAWDNRVEKIPLKDTEDMRAPLRFSIRAPGFEERI